MTETISIHGRSQTGNKRTRVERRPRFYYYYYYYYYRQVTDTTVNETFGFRSKQKENRQIRRRNSNSRLRLFAINEYGKTIYARHEPVSVQYEKIASIAYVHARRISHLYVRIIISYDRRAARRAYVCTTGERAARVWKSGGRDTGVTRGDGERTPTTTERGTDSYRGMDQWRE